MADIHWINDSEEVASVALEKRKPILIDFRSAKCGACRKLAEETYSDDEVASYINDNFIPWEADYDADTSLIRHYDIYVTPTVIFADEEAKERFRSVGFLPPRRFLAQLAMGRAKVALGRHRYEEAGDLFEEVSSRFPECSVAPEAIYFRGVARDKLTEDETNRRLAARELVEKCPDSDWAARAVLWLD